MKKAFIIGTVVLVTLVGCSTTMQKHRNYIRKGILISGLNQFAFAEEWGTPNQQGTWIEESGSLYAQFKAVPFNPRFEASKGRKLYNDVWVYYKQNKILFFSEHRLMAHYDWDEYQKTERERKELPSIMK